MENTIIALRRLKRLGFDSSTLSEIGNGLVLLHEHLFQQLDSKRNEESDSRSTSSYENLRNAVSEMENQIETCKALSGWHEPLDWASRAPTSFWLACNAFEVICDEISKRECQIRDANARIKARCKKKMAG
jgi:hypothetical protein